MCTGRRRRGQNLEGVLSASNSGFAVGNAVTMADFAIYYITDVVTEMLKKVASGPTAVELLFGDKPALAKHKAMMAARPGIIKLKASAQWADCAP